MSESVQKNQRLLPSHPLSLIFLFSSHLILGIPSSPPPASVFLYPSIVCECNPPAHSSVHRRSSPLRVESWSGHVFAFFCVSHTSLTKVNNRNIALSSPSSSSSHPTLVSHRYLFICYLNQQSLHLVSRKSDFGQNVLIFVLLQTSEYFSESQLHARRFAFSLEQV